MEQVKQRKWSCSYFIAIIFITCPNSLRLAVGSTAARRRSFNRNVISLSTLKATQATVSVSGVAGEGANVSSVSQWFNPDAVVKRHRGGAPAHHQLISATRQVCTYVCWSTWN